MTKLIKNPLGMWADVVCEIRAELRSYDGDTSYARALCDDLENSLIQFARTGATKRISFEACLCKAGAEWVEDDD